MAYRSVDSPPAHQWRDLFEGCPERPSLSGKEKETKKINTYKRSPNSIGRHERASPFKLKDQPVGTQLQNTKRAQKEFDHNESVAPLVPIKIEFEKNTGRVFVWSNPEIDTSPSDFSFHQRIEDCHSQGIDMKVDDMRGITNGEGESLNIDQTRNPDACTLDKKEKMIVQDITRGEKIKDVSMRRKKKSSDSMFTDTTSMKKSIKYNDMLQSDIDTVAEKAIKRCINTADNEVFRFIKKLAALIIEDISVEKKDHLLQVNFGSRPYKKLLIPLADNPLYVYEQYFIFRSLILEFIENVKESTLKSEYCRRFLTLMAQFCQEKLLDQWKAVACHLSENVREASCMLKIQDEWPIFEFDEVRNVQFVEERLKSLSSDEQRQFKVIFFGQEDKKRLLMMGYFHEAEMRKYKLSYSAPELKILMNSGICIPLLLQIDLALELSSEEFKWRDLSKDECQKKLVAVYFAMQGYCVYEGKSIKLLPLDWEFSPVKVLLLGKIPQSERFQSRVKNLISFGKDQPALDGVNWLGDKESKDMEGQLFNPGEALASAYSEIQMKDIAFLKKQLRLIDGVRSGSRRISKKAGKTLDCGNLTSMECWPKTKRDEKRILTDSMRKQRQRFIKYFDLLDIPISKTEKSL